jgi:hypothetical protein
MPRPPALSSIASSATPRSSDYKTEATEFITEESSKAERLMKPELVQIDW